MSFNDDTDWASAAASPSSAANGASRNITPSTNSRTFVSEEFLDDFDDDDDAFFSSATAGAGGGAAAAGTGFVDSVNKPASQSSAMSTFGMVALNYGDAALRSTSSMRGSSSTRPTSPTLGADTGDGIGEDDISDDAELLELDRRHLIHLRNPSSPYRTVARSCLALNQLVYAADHSGNQSNANVSSSSTTSQLPIQIESSSIYHIQRHQRLISRILSSLKTCVSSHNLSPCRSLASKTLATTARASYARLRFDARLTSVRLPPSIATRLEDECGNGAAYSLVVAAVDQGDDGASSAALEALGRLTLDPHTDNLSAEVRGIAECASPNVFMYENDSKSYWILEHSFAMREMQSKAWEHVVFPRMQHILHRIALYSSPHHLARAIPVVTAAFVHALTRGHDTMPSRRAMQTGKASHGKRGWREVDAEGLAREYVDGILLPCLVGHKSFHPNQCDKALKCAIATACIRMSSAAPNAVWGVSACRHAVTVLLQKLNKEMTLAPSSAHPSWKSPTMTQTTDIGGIQKESSSPISSTIAPASVPIEALAGTASLLVIALRGIPLHERAPGLADVLRAALLYIPLGKPVVSGAGCLDLPTGSVNRDGQTEHYTLGRIGLLTEVALSVMLDGATNTKQSGIQQSNNGTITGTRSVLLQRIFSSDQLDSIWDRSTNKKDSNYHPVDELLWVFCSVATHVGNQRGQVFAKYSASAVEWCNLSLVILDFFAKTVCNPGSPRSKSPFTDAGHYAYNVLFEAVLKRCGAHPLSALYISENMLPNSLGTASSLDKASPVVGGPGKQLHNIAAALSKVSTKILFLRDKSKQNVAQMGDVSVEASSNFIQLVALLVDAWLGNCIMNHDTKQSNESQLDLGVMFLPLCHSEVKFMLQKHRTLDEEENIILIAQLCRVLIASLENMACMSELLVHFATRDAKEETASDKQGALLAMSMLNEIIICAKEGASADTKQGSMLCYQVALDANNAISRIDEFVGNRPQSYPEDIASAFPVSPLIGVAISKPSLFPPGNRGPIEHCVWFLYHHARIISMHRTDSALKAFAPTMSVSSSSKLIQPHNALRIPSAFSHSIIEPYQKLPDLPLLIPARSSKDGVCEVVALTGSSDPFSLVLSHGVQRARKSNSAEDAVVVVTLRLYNITPVSIQNGIRLDLKIAQETRPGNNRDVGDGSNCVATSVYKHEIKGGDFVTWEVILGNWRVGNLSIQPSVTFRELEQESSTQTHKWVSGGGPDNDHTMPSEVIDNEDESVLDVTIPCKRITLSPISSLQPCPLVFFGGLGRCKSNFCGDTSSFEFLWNSMEGCQSRLPFVILNAQMEGNSKNVIQSLADTKKGYVFFSSSTRNKDDATNQSSLATGCAFVAPDGCRILCMHYMEGGDTHVLNVRSDSSGLLESLIGTPTCQTYFVEFVFGANVMIVDGGNQRRPMDKLSDMGHDFPSMNMPAKRPILT